MQAVAGTGGAAASQVTASGPSLIPPAPHNGPAMLPDIAAFAAQVVAKAKDGDRHFDIRLDPQDFGRIDVHLSVSSDGRAQAHLAADKPQTLELLQRDQATLHRALKDAGLEVRNNALNFSLKGQERGDGGAGRYASRAPSRTFAETTNVTNSPPTFAGRPASGRLDIRI